MSQGEPGVLRVVGPHAPAGQRGPRVLGNEGAESPLDPGADESLTIGEGLPSPGRYIREQRQRRGMSVEQLAVATKIPRSSVILLEEDRFDELPGPVFVKGFLRCAARSLGVDADAVMELLYERERAQLHNRRRDKPVSRPTGNGAARPTGARARPTTARTAGAPSSRVQSGEGSAPVATADGVVPRMPPRIRKQAPARSPSAVRAMLTRMPSVSVLLWIVIAVLVAMVVMAAFNLVGHATTGAGA